MKKSSIAAAASLLIAVNAHSAYHLNEDFSTYSDGELVGQQGWTQWGATSTNPVMVVDGRAVVTGIPGATSDTQQNVQKAFNVAATPGSTFYYGYNFQVTGAGNNNQGFSSYYSTGLLDQNPDGPFVDSRVSFTNIDGTFFQLSLRLNGQGSNPPQEISEFFEFGNNDINLVFSWTFADGENPDVMNVWLDPQSAEDAPDLTFTNLGSQIVGGFSGLIFAQDLHGSDVAFSKAVVADTFGEVLAVVPEPGTVALVGLGMAAILWRSRRALSR